VMFGEYCEVHDEPDPTNTQQPWLSLWVLREIARER